MVGCFGSVLLGLIHQVERRHNLGRTVPGAREGRPLAVRKRHLQSRHSASRGHALRYWSHQQRHRFIAWYNLGSHCCGHVLKGYVCSEPITWVHQSVVERHGHDRVRMSRRIHSSNSLARIRTRVRCRRWLVQLRLHPSGQSASPLPYSADLPRLDGPSVEWQIAFWVLRAHRATRHLPSHHAGWPHRTAQLDLRLNSGVWGLLRRVWHRGLPQGSQQTQCLHRHRREGLQYGRRPCLRRRRQPAVAQVTRPGRSPLHPRRRRQVRWSKKFLKQPKYDRIDSNSTLCGSLNRDPNWIVRPLVLLTLYYAFPDRIQKTECRESKHISPRLECSFHYSNSTWPHPYWKRVWIFQSTAVFSFPTSICCSSERKWMLQPYGVENSRTGAPDIHLGTGAAPIDAH